MIAVDNPSIPSPMNAFKHRLLALLLLLSATVTLQAQIPDEVTAVLRKCAQAMGHPNGVEYEMSLKAKVALVTVMSGQINAFAKDRKNKFFFTMKVLGQPAKSAGGFDGIYQWRYTQGAESDTVYVRKSDQKAKSDFDLNFHIDLEYRKASIKSHFGNYVITFTDPTLWKKNEDSAESKEEAGAGIREALNVPGVVLTLIAFFAYCSGEATCFLWTSSYFAGMKEGLSDGLIASFGSLIFGGLMLGRLISGFISNKLGDRLLIRIGITVDVHFLI